MKFQPVFSVCVHSFSLELAFGVRTLSDVNVYPLRHESESLRHAMKALFFSVFTSTSVMVRDYMLVAVVSTVAVFVRNGPNFYSKTIEVGSIVV